MKISDATFLASYTSVDHCPPPLLPEYAFIGRSNVGKSSLINMLTGRKNLAKTSSRPGKTQLINLFLINNKWNLADLPGYGFAKISKTKRDEWDAMIGDYLKRRKNLMTVFILVDARLAPQKIDLEFINSVGENRIPLLIVFTKADKVSANQLKNNINSFLKKLEETWEELPAYFVTSSGTKKGREELLKYIEETNRESERMRK